MQGETVRINFLQQQQKIGRRTFKMHIDHTINVYLNQQVLGARPAANITWYNNSIPLQNDENTGIEIKERTVTAAIFHFPY